MALSVHNVPASVANLARMILQGLDRTRETSVVPTVTLALMLETLVDLAEPKRREHAEKQARTVRDSIASFATAERERDEDQQQERGGEPPKRRAWG